MADSLVPQSVRDKFPRLSLQHVLLLQAHIRGTIVRSHMKSVREEFINVLNEIQPNDNIHVFWKSQFPCLPSFTTAKEEKPKCLGLNLKAVQNSDNPRETITSENDFSISKEDQRIPCSLCVQIFNDRLSTVSPQFSANNSNKPVTKDANTDSQYLFSDDRKESEISKLENDETIHHLPVSKEGVLGNPIAVEQDSQSVKSFDISDESQQKDSKITFINPEHCQTLPENEICNLGDKDIGSHEPNNDGKNIESTNSSLCLKLSEKDDRSEMQTLDSTLTDVTSVWDSVRSLSPGVSQSDTSRAETIASLQLQRQNIALELVWLQQAILSRKNYLRLKSQMDS